MAQSNDRSPNLYGSLIMSYKRHFPFFWGEENKSVVVFQVCSSSSILHKWGVVVDGMVVAVLLLLLIGSGGSKKRNLILLSFFFFFPPIYSCFRHKKLCRQMRSSWMEKQPLPSTFAFFCFVYELKNQDSGGSSLFRRKE